MRHSILFISLILTYSCHIADEVAPDQEIWEYALPENEALSNQSLLDINGLIQLNEFLEINGLVIIRNDKLVFENYYDREVDSFGTVTRNPTLRNREQSTSIGMAGIVVALTAIGVAEDKRLLSLDDPISNYLPAYSDIFNDDPQKEEITIAHLLTHRSGLAWNESIFPFSSENDLNQMKSSNDWIGYILEKPILTPPGFQYNLNNGMGIILAEIIETVSGQDYETFLNENVLNPLTISSFTIETDPQGNFNSGDGISLSLLDWTKLGYLYLNEGTWNGRRILDPNFVLEATAVQDVISGTFSQGYAWQQYGDDLALFFGIPHDEIYFIRGGVGQLLAVIPSENMIVSIFAENFFFGFLNPSLNLIAEITNSFQ